MDISLAQKEDLPAILHLQKQAFLKEAERLDNYQIQPLTQNLQDMELEFADGVFLKLTTAYGIIIGSVRAHAVNGIAYVGKLMVHQDYQGMGHGTRLLLAIEKYFPRCTFELFTSSHSLDNIRLYTRNGYNEYTRRTVDDKLELVFMRKASNV